MSELTKEYFDQHFDDLLRAVKEGFDATASRVEFQEMRKELKSDISDLAFKLGQLADEVKEFVVIVKKQESEYVELKIKYHELEKRVVRLEAGLQAA